MVWTSLRRGKYSQLRQIFGVENFQTFQLAVDSETVRTTGFAVASQPGERFLVSARFSFSGISGASLTAARKDPVFFSYSDNYLIDTDHGVILDVEATRSIRQAEVESTKIMLRRVKDKFDLRPERLIADTAYGTASGFFCKATK